MSHVKLTQDEKDIEKLIQSIDANEYSHDIKRKLKVLNTGEIEANGVIHNHKTIIDGEKSKNCRKSRNGKGRGLPKKGGGGGKGTWGKLGAEYPTEGPFIDKNDPNYDSESSDDVVAEVLVHELSVEDFTKQIGPIIKEYYNHGDTQEVMDSLRELNLGSLHKPELSYLALSMALDRKDDDKELTSVLLADLHNNFVTQGDVEQAFTKVITSLPELVIDIPEASTVLGNFIARAIADDCLQPESINRFYKLLEQSHTSETTHFKSALARAEYLLSLNLYTNAANKLKGKRLNHLPGMDLHNVWGNTGASKPVKTLAKAMERSLKEYAHSSGDIVEAGRSLLELHVPHFHHEYVFLAICLAIEDGTKRTAVRVRDLLESLLSQGILDVNAIEKGFERAIEYLPEMCLDVPNAHSLLEKFVSMCCTDDDVVECGQLDEMGQGDEIFNSNNPTMNCLSLNGMGDGTNDIHKKRQLVRKPRNRVRSGCFTTIITKDILAKLPNKGRKRFVSEGDGGLLKYNGDIDPFK